jgi:hypothetical protein
MKTAFLFILASLVTINLFAQTGSPEPLQLNRTFLVNSAGLPEEFLLFIPDSAVQILFNPAKANNYSGSFIYVNYLSDFTYPYFTHEIFPSLYAENYTSSKNPSISLASLFQIGKAKWLIEFTNGINRYKNLSNTINSQKRIYEPDLNYETDTNNSEANYSSDGSKTTLKLSRIFNSGGTNFSLGMYGIISTNSSNAYSIDQGNHFYYYRPGSDSSISISNDYYDHGSNGNSKNKKYAIGLEFTANNNSWDYIGSIDYQFADNSSIRKIYENYIHLDSIYTSLYGLEIFTNMQHRDIDNVSDQKPSTINLNNYFRHSAGWFTENDQVFISMNLFYSFGTLSYTNVYYNLFKYTSNQTLDSSSVINTYSDKFDSKNWGANLSAGYVLSKKMTDIDVITGLKINGKIENIKSINESYNYPGYFFETLTVKPKFVSFTLPFYLYYTPVQWISVYGGINYSYGYRSIKSEAEISGISIQSYYTTELMLSTKEYSIDQGWQSYKSIYFGCELRHSSGLRLQFLFDKDIGIIPDWNVSLGYNF